ncbi:MAG: 5-(carboxyamino)imidazole ribonucleotide synthase [Myxococcota bacterium]
MSAFYPGSTVGVIGGGQLARMMFLEARRMGHRTAVLSPEGESAAPVADEWVQGPLDDLEAAQRLTALSDVVTLDTEHVPASLLSELERSGTVRPSSAVLRTIQDRQAQRRFLEEIGAPQPVCKSVDSLATLREQVAAVGVPCVLKTRRAGYDGKGQTVIRDEDDADAAWAAVGENPAMLEAFVPFDMEISVLLARRPSGEIRFYPVAHNVHQRHILHTTVAPAPISDSLVDEAKSIATNIAQNLDHVGMMAVEMFVVEGSTLLVNEIAPRPHNSGHYTFGACATSQFEQHVRAVLDLPLGETTLRSPAATVNLLGDLWQDGEPDWSAVYAHPEAHLHLYGKREARVGRKMGHVLVLGPDAKGAVEKANAILDALAKPR